MLIVAPSEITKLATELLMPRFRAFVRSPIRPHALRKICNELLDLRIQKQLGVENDPEGFSIFRDGGLCPGFPLDLIEGIKHIPVIVVTIDLQDPGLRDKPISIFHTLLAKEMRVKILDNLNEIRSRRSLSVLCVPCPSYVNSKFATRFNITEAEGRSMYDTGHVMAKTHLFMRPIALPVVEEVPTPEPLAVEASVAEVAVIQ